MDKRIIDFTVQGQEITFSVADPIPRGDTQQYLTAHFSVDAAWAGLALQAVFQRKGRAFSSVTVPLDGEMVCDFPPSLLTAPEGGGTVYVRVGLVGIGENGKRLTTGCAAVPVAPSCYVRGEAPGEPPRDVYAELLGMVGAKLDANQGAANAGKVLGVGADGAVVPVDAPAAALPDAPAGDSESTGRDQIVFTDWDDGKQYLLYVRDGKLRMKEMEG